MIPRHEDGPHAARRYPRGPARSSAPGARALSVVIALLAVLAPGLAAAQTELPTAADVAEAQAGYERVLAAALEAPEDGPILHQQMAWGTVMSAAYIAERVRQLAAGEDGAVDADAIREQVLAEVRAARPDSPLAEILSLSREYGQEQGQNPLAKSQAYVELQARYPEHPGVLEVATRALRESGADEQAASLAEAFLGHSPGSPVAYKILSGLSRDHRTRQLEILQRWAEAVPGDPELVGTWVDSGLVEREPEATERLFEALFESRPGGFEGLRACRQILALEGSGHEDRARACVARIAADPEQQEPVQQSASQALIDDTARSGDWAGLRASLDELEPEVRSSALLSAAFALRTPEACGEVLALLGQALSDLPSGRSPSLASRLRGCDEFPAAHALYLDLLRRTPDGELDQTVDRWLIRGRYGDYSGEVPQGMVELLEQRAAAGAFSAHLARALDRTYQAAGLDERRLPLLLRWHEAEPTSMRKDEALALADLLLWDDRGDEATDVLSGALERRFERQVAEALWAVHLQRLGPEAAERFAAALAGNEEPVRSRAGYLLLARSALLRGDPEAIELYWEALGEEGLDLEIAAEILGALNAADDGGDPASVLAAARQLCDRLPREETCATDLLSRAGLAALAAGELATLTGEETPEELKEIASVARKGGDLDLAERALREVIAVDPLDESGWTFLAAVLEEQAKSGELEALLATSRQHFTPPPSPLARATGRALTPGDPRRAAEILLQTRDALSERDDYTRGWIDHELRTAYQRLAELEAIETPTEVEIPTSLRPAAVPEMADATAAELRRAGHDLYQGTGGRYDPEAGLALMRRAAARGDAMAAYRVALFADATDQVVWPGEPTPRELYRSSRQEVERLAAEGDPFARYLVGTAALVGLDGRKDYATALRWLRAAAEQGEVMAWHNLGWMLRNGYGLEAPDREAALAAYRKGVAGGAAISARGLAEMTMTRDSPAAECREGLAALEGAIAAGDPEAAGWLASLQLYGRDDCVTRDLDAAVAGLEVAAEAEVQGAAYNLAVALLLRDGAAARQRATDLLETSAALPNALAMELLAFLRATGTILPRDPAAADRWVAEAARVGSDGLLNLGREARSSEVMRTLIDQGAAALRAAAAEGDAFALGFRAWLLSLWLAEDLEEDLDAAERVAVARRAAEAGSPRGMRTLHSYYLRGDGVDKDLAASHAWRQRCAEAGDSFCMMFLGNALLDGDGVERDARAGLGWLRRSAAAGNWWAVRDLGNLYAGGRSGIAADPAEAAVWKRQLADLGDAEARGWLRLHGYAEATTAGGRDR